MSRTDWNLRLEPPKFLNSLVGNKRKGSLQHFNTSTSSLDVRLPTTCVTTSIKLLSRSLFHSFPNPLYPTAASPALRPTVVCRREDFKNTRRSYAKGRRMPPKKAVKEEKVLLGRPGNNLKSGIVSHITNWSFKTHMNRSDSQMWESQPSSKLSRNAHWVTLP